MAHRQSGPDGRTTPASDETGALLLDLWTRADMLTAFVASAATTVSGEAGATISGSIAADLADTLACAEVLRTRISQGQSRAAELALTLARIAARLDQWLAESGLTMIEGRPVDDLRARLKAVTSVQPSLAIDAINPRGRRRTAEATRPIFRHCRYSFSRSACPMV